ncbi:hypothetical protein GCM10008119_08670 [Pedobacter mendelii]|uniref:Uncharacterized protein n=1 Tax=Pedobacter mendelii TaxID=1908240 RepID=A0ABQ2BGH1_9SPHI|nr:hypothetical protein GCM10008119_08670 [Pedobacter mendelii]
MINYQYVNNFRLVNNKCKPEKPPKLIKYKVILGYQVYYSTFNKKLFVIFDHIKNQYCSFENNGESTDLDMDLKENVKRIQ